MGNSIIQIGDTFGTIIKKDGEWFAVECREDGTFVRYVFDCGFSAPERALAHLRAGMDL